MDPIKGNIISNSFKTFESVFTGFRMFYKMTLMLLIGIILLHVITIGIVVKINPNSILKVSNNNHKYRMNKQDICLIKLYAIIQIKDKLNLFNSDYEIPYSCEGNNQMINRSQYESVFKSYIENVLLLNLIRNIKYLLLITSPIYLLYFIILYVFHKQFQKANKEKMMRGKKLIKEFEMEYFLRNYDDSYKFRINDYISVPESIVTRHSLAIGKIGSGKSQLIFPFVEQLLNRGVKTIIHDFKGDFIPSFYDKNKHYIFNPLDVRHMGNDDDSCDKKGWTVFNDLKEEPDIDSFVSSLIPASKNSDAFWYMAPRDILKAMIIYCIKNDKKTNKDLLNMFRMPREELINRFTEVDGCDIALSHLEDGKLAGQLSSVMRTFTSSLRYLEGTDGTFSIEDWVKDNHAKKNVIFISNNAKVQDTLKTLIATFFDFTSRTLCSLDDDQDRRLYMILDEFGQLSKMGSIVQLLTQSRSKGGAVFILIQDFSQIEALYGPELARSIVNSCGNKFYFAVDDEKTADFLSRQIGTNEIERTKENKSFGVEDLRDSISLNKEIIEKRIVLPSEIMSQVSTFDNMSFYLQLTNMPLTKVTIKGKQYPYNCEKYRPRKLLITHNSENSVKTTPEEKVADTFFEELANIPVEENSDIIIDESGNNSLIADSDNNLVESVEDKMEGAF